MSKKPYYCGKCNRRYRTRSKYCPHCGAYVSIPLSERLTDEVYKSPYEISLKAWAIVCAIFLIVGIETFFAARAFLKRIHGRPQAKAAAAPPAAQPEEMVDVKFGTLVICDPCGIVAEDNTGVIRVRKSNADKQKVTKIHTAECDLCGGYVFDDNYPPPQGQSLRIGMEKHLVWILWGKPIRQVFTTRNGEPIERWYFGDPVFGISSASRYVDFNSFGQVIFIHEIEGIGRR